MSVARQHAEWLRLVDISGPFLSVPVIKDAFPQGLDAHEPEVSRRLRDGYEDWQGDRSLHKGWVRYVLGEVLGHPDEVLLEGQAIPPGLRHTVGEHRETLAPDLVLAEPEGGKARVLIQVHPPGTDLERPLAGSRWKESPAGRMAVLLRGTQVRLGLVTNGERWTLVDAPPNATTGYATWKAEFWLDEPLTLRAFRTLLGPRRLFGVPEKETLEALLAESAERQQEVTDQLGRQVRRAVEILVHALDRTDRESKGALLAGVSERELYDAAVTFMMRLVFLFCAEEQGLFPLDDEQYAGNYAASTLFGQLNDAADETGGQVLDRRTDAWQRLLATFRAIHGGVDHEGMALPPYGGHLFDPDRFPFLEGRPRDSRWKMTAARPLPISNLTVLHLLSALQLLRDAKTGEAQRLSFRALDIEQIGHVYEGLLDHTVRRAPTPMVSLKGKEAEEPEVEVSRLEELLAKGPAALAAAVAEMSGRSEKAIAKDLVAALPADGEHLLAVACENDAALAARVRPFAGLVRRDADGLPVVIPAGSHFVTAGSDRRSTGTHYTPRSLTEPIVRYTLEPLVYEGPAEGKPEDEWVLKPAKEILALKVCDMACGSGAFLVEACRYLSKRLVEAWAEAEAQNPGKVLITPEGAMSEARLSESIIPKEDEERLALARRLVVDRCLYGVDINPMAVEMAKLSLWLVTLQKNVAFTFLDHCIRCGDSLLGVTDLRQIETLSMDPSKATAPLFLEEACRKAVERAREARDKLEGFTVKDVKDAEAKEGMLREAEEAIGTLRTLADLVVGIASHQSLQLSISQLQGHAETILEGPGSAKAAGLLQDLRSVADAVLARSGPAQSEAWRPFHWALELPEVTRRSGFHAILGNPPFVGGRLMPERLGVEYSEVVRKLLGPVKDPVDLVSFFFRRSAHLVGAGAHVGLLATKTIAETATKKASLDYLLAKGFVIHRAETARLWPGEAGVTVAVIHLARRNWSGQCWLDGRAVDEINSSLNSLGSGDAPLPLLKTVRCSQGVNLFGRAFVLTEADRADWLGKCPSLEKYIRVYINGDVFGEAMTDRPQRWCIDFGSRDRSQIEGCDEVLDFLVREVTRERANQTRQIHEARPWLHWDKREAFFSEARSLSRMIGCVSPAQFLVFDFVDPSALFDVGLRLFASDSEAILAVLQSGIHEAWAWATSSKMGSALRYLTSASFETYPWPPDLGRELAELGGELVDGRWRWMRSRNVGRTGLYERLHSPEEQSEEMRRLRGLHEAIDRRVVAIYGWGDLDLDHGFRETRRGVRFVMSDESRVAVLDRLLKLNHQRHAEEVAQGVRNKGAKGSKQPKARRGGRKPATADTTDTLISLDEEE